MTQERHRGDILPAAIAYARSNGATTLEAYPVEVPTGERIPSANAFHGTLTMFERAGFAVVERRQWNATSPVRPIVRLALLVTGRQPPKRPTTSSVGNSTSSSVRVDIGFSRRVDCRPARMSRAQ